MNLKDNLAVQLLKHKRQIYGSSKGAALGRIAISSNSVRTGEEVLSLPSRNPADCQAGWA
jgi:hypothetical protein